MSAAEFLRQCERDWESGEAFNYAITVRGIDRVEIVHDEENVASGRIPRKLGCTEIGRRPHPPDRPAAADDVIDIGWRLTR